MYFIHGFLAFSSIKTKGIIGVIAMKRNQMRTLFIGWIIVYGIGKYAQVVRIEQIIAETRINSNTQSKQLPFLQS